MADDLTPLTTVNKKNVINKQNKHLTHLPPKQVSNNDDWTQEIGILSFFFQMSPGLDAEMPASSQTDVPSLSAAPQLGLVREKHGFWSTLDISLKIIKIWHYSIALRHLFAEDVVFSFCFDFFFPGLPYKMSTNFDLKQYKLQVKATLCSLSTLKW